MILRDSIKIYSLIRRHKVWTLFLSICRFFFQFVILLFTSQHQMRNALFEIVEKMSQNWRQACSPNWTASNKTRIILALNAQNKRQRSLAQLKQFSTEQILDVTWLRILSGTWWHENKNPLLPCWIVFLWSRQQKRICYCLVNFRSMSWIKISFTDSKDGKWPNSGTLFQKGTLFRNVANCYQSLFIFFTKNCWFSEQ